MRDVSSVYVSAYLNWKWRIWVYSCC